MEVLTLTHPKDLDVLHATFAAPDLTLFCRLGLSEKRWIWDWPDRKEGQ